MKSMNNKKFSIIVTIIAIVFIGVITSVTVPIFMNNIKGSSLGNENDDDVAAEALLKEGFRVARNLKLQLGESMKWSPRSNQECSIEVVGESENASLSARTTVGEVTRLANFSIDWLTSENPEDNNNGGGSSDDGFVYNPNDPSNNTTGGGNINTTDGVGRPGTIVIWDGTTVPGFSVTDKQDRKEVTYINDSKALRMVEKGALAIWVNFKNLVKNDDIEI
ncbi:MAG: hypothetical protein ACRC37_03010, partial [Lentisphaeria bacterium]